MRNERSPDELRSEIERTRAEMTGTVEAMEKKLSPERFGSAVNRNLREMSDIAQNKIRAMGGKIARNMGRRSLPTALLLIGISWLVISISKNRKFQRHEY